MYVLVGECDVACIDRFMVLSDRHENSQWLPHICPPCGVQGKFIFSPLAQHKIGLHTFWIQIADPKS
jgi:hypothetical protein